MIWRFLFRVHFPLTLTHVAGESAGHVSSGLQGEGPAQQDDVCGYEGADPGAEDHDGGAAREDERVRGEETAQTQDLLSLPAVLRLLRDNE